MLFIPPPAVGEDCGRCRRPLGHPDAQESFVTNGTTSRYQDWCPGFEHWLCARCVDDDTAGRTLEDKCWFEREHVLDPLPVDPAP